jgi:tetratricopeptide (TPR) repeat protein
VPMKSWFRGSGDDRGGQEAYTVDDLVVLERYQEAAERLRAKLKSNPEDLHSHLKLAEVYTQLKETGNAVLEYCHVADEYAEDGFYDKGIALLLKALKLDPNDTSLRLKFEQMQREKSMDHTRNLAIEGLREAGGDGTSALELQRMWHNMAGSSLVEQLAPEQVRRLVSLMEILRVGAGSVLANEGEKSPALFLIVRGVIDATARGSDGRESTIRSFSGGDVVGEAVLLEHSVWPARYQVSEEATVLRLTREGLEAALTGNPDPRGFIDVLRGQHNDRDVAATVRRMRGG